MNSAVFRMHLTRVLGICFVIFPGSDALIEFAKSRIYDERDFRNTRSVVLNEYCANGCNVYVSVPENSVDIAQWIYIVNAPEKTSIIANSTDKDGRKIPFATKGDQVYFESDIYGLKAPPLLIWVVQQDAPYYDSVEIYDAADLNRASAPAQLITVMSTEPYVVTTDTGGPMTVSAYTAGFDAFDSVDKCTRVLRQEDPATYQDLEVSVRSPLFTLFFDKLAFKDSKIALHTSKYSDAAVYDLAKPMFVTSPGYIGCSVKEGKSKYGGVYTKTFRSSLYNDTTKFTLKTHDPLPLVLTGDVVSDVDNAVTVEADGIVIWTAINSSEETQIDVTARELEIKWTRNTADLSQYFMMRVEQDYGLPKTTTAKPEEPRITTLESATTTVQPSPTTSVIPTTSGASYGSLLLPIGLAAVFLL